MTQMRFFPQIQRTWPYLPVATTAIESPGVLPAKGLRAVGFQQGQCFF